MQNKMKKEYETLLKLEELRIKRQFERKQQLNQVLGLKLN